MVRKALVHQRIATNGITLHCVTSGEGAHLVVLLHGFPECWHSWSRVIPALARHFRVAAPDLRGYNESDKPAGVSSYRVSELVADVYGLIQALGYERATVVGHDWGGAVAWSFAMQRPAAVERLAVLNCPHPAKMMAHLWGGNLRQLARSWYMFFFQIPWLPEWLIARGEYAVLDWIMRRGTVRSGAFTEEDMRVLKAAAAKPGALTSAINYYRAAFRGSEVRQRRPGFPKISAPSLLIWAENDIALGKELTEGMAELFSGPFEIIYIPNCSHWVQYEQPELVSKHLLDFLQPLAGPEDRSAMA